MHTQTVFLERLPRRPYCSNDLDAGIRIRPAEAALEYRHIQPNQPVAVSWLVFDIDYDFPAAVTRWDMPNHPPPTITVVNPQNGHAHLIYGLKTPVIMSDAAREAPIRYAAIIQAALRAALDADNSYAGLIAKNPLHPDWQVEWLNKLYDLGELAEYVTLPKRIPTREQYGLGRNCSLFDELRVWAYQWIRIYKRNAATSLEWQCAVLGQAERLNVFDSPLSPPEVRAIAKSVSKWVWQRFNEQAFRALQSVRGKCGGRPRSTTKDGNPWEIIGVSRSTFYRRLSSGILVPN